MCSVFTGEKQPWHNISQIVYFYITSAFLPFWPNDSETVNVRQEPLRAILEFQYTENTEYGVHCVHIPSLESTCPLGLTLLSPARRVFLISASYRPEKWILQWITRNQRRGWFAVSLFSRLTGTEMLLTDAIRSTEHTCNSSGSAFPLLDFIQLVIF